MYRLIAWLLYTAKHTANTAGCTEEYFINGILKEWGILNGTPPGLRRLLMFPI